MKIKPLLLSFFLGAFVLLVPAGQAHAALVFDNITGKTQDSSSWVTGGLITFTPTASGNLTDFIEPMAYAVGFGVGPSTSLVYTLYGPGGYPTSPLDCTTPGTTFAGYGFTDNSVPPLYTPLVDVNDWSGTQCALTAGTSYTIHLNVASAMRSPFSAEDMSHPWAQIYVDGITPPPGSCSAGDFGTCIASVIPADDPSILNYASSTQAIATSTTFAFGSDGYISPADYQPGAYVENLYQNDDYDQVASALCSIGGCRTQNKYPISASGSYSVSTSTDIERIGNYTMTTDIKVPVSVNVFNFFSFNVPSFLPFSEKVLVSTTTNFQVSQPSSLDIVKNKLGQTYLAVGITNHASSTAATLVSGCAFTSITGIFDLTSQNNIFSCVVGFVSASLIPSAQQLEAIAANFQASIGVRPPIGYITRFSAIVSGQAIGTSTLPGLTISVPPILGLGTESATFPVWTNLMGSTSPFGMATSSVARGSKTFRQIVEPGWDIIVLTILAFLIIWDALKIKH